MVTTWLFFGSSRVWKGLEVGGFQALWPEHAPESPAAQDRMMGPWRVWRREGWCSEPQPGICRNHTSPRLSGNMLGTGAESWVSEEQVPSHVLGIYLLFGCLPLRPLPPPSHPPAQRMQPRSHGMRRGI